MAKKIYLETLKSVLDRSIFHYFSDSDDLPLVFIPFIRENIRSTFAFDTGRTTALLAEGLSSLNLFY